MTKEPDIIHASIGYVSGDGYDVRGEWVISAANMYDRWAPYIRLDPDALLKAGFVPVDSVVSVKPLRLERTKHRTAERWTVNSVVGNYSMERDVALEMWVLRRDHVKIYDHEYLQGCTDFMSVDYEQRTLSAITTQPADPDAYALGYNAAIEDAGEIADEFQERIGDAIRDLMRKPTQETDK